MPSSACNNKLFCDPDIIDFPMAKIARRPLSRLVARSRVKSFPTRRSSDLLVTALTTRIGMEYGTSSPVFALAAVFAGVVLYDAAGVRRAVRSEEHTSELQSRRDLVCRPLLVTTNCFAIRTSSIFRWRRSHVVLFRDSSRARG